MFLVEKKISLFDNNSSICLIFEIENPLQLYEHNLKLSIVIVVLSWQIISAHIILNICFHVCLWLKL